MKAVQKGKKRVLGEHSGLKPVRTGLTRFSDTDVSLVKDNNVLFFFFFEIHPRSHPLPGVASCVSIQRDLDQRSFDVDPTIT